MKVLSSLLPSLILTVWACFGTATQAAEALPAALQAKVDNQFKALQSWAAEPAIVNAVKAQNAALSPEAAAMTQEKWKSLSVLDPFVRALSKNEAGLLLKSKKSDIVTEAFLSDAAGLKVALINKTSFWSHKGKDKHDQPMAGKNWQGSIETDESTGQRQLQISVPVLDGGKPIGSLVVGLSVSKLEAD